MNRPSVEIAIFDTTLRDGAQSLPDKHQFQHGNKPLIAHNIARLGADVIEAGFPATPGDAEEVREVAAIVGASTYEVMSFQDDRMQDPILRSPVIAGLCRVVPSDIETTWETVGSANRSRIHTFISTDPEHMRAKFPDKSPEDVLAMGMRAVGLAKEMTNDHPDATVQFSAEAASTTDLDYLERVVKEAVQYGADIINVPDTVGQRDPFWMHGFYGKVIEWATSMNPNVTVSAHNHNDLGHANANTIALMYAAVQHAAKQHQNVKIQLEGTVCGLGERAGNADLFPVAASILKFAPSMEVPVHWTFNPSDSVRVANAVMGYADLEVDRQSPVVGKDTNTHRSGIHSDGVAKGGHRIYTPHDPEFWGHSQNAVHENGRYQGNAGRALAR